MARLRNLWEALRSSFWFVPTLLALGAVALSVVLGRVDTMVGEKFAANLGWIYTGGPQGARGVLSAIAGSVIGVAGTTFSITIAVLSLTSGQFGPRLLRSFMRDFGNQVVLGTFTATFLYCLLVLRTIRGTDAVTYVPHVSVTVGVVLAVLSVGVLIYFVNHVAESIQVSHLIEMVGNDADEAVRRTFPSSPSAPEPPVETPTSEPSLVCSEAIGYLDSVDEASLRAIAREHGLLVRLEVRPGEYVMPQMKLLSVWPGAHEQEAALRGAFSCGRDRTTLQDVEFAFLQLSEVAVRALSPGINDPFTAVTCVDRITAAMCLVASRSWPPECHYDEQHVPRLLVRVLRPAELIEAGYGHIRRAAESSPHVQVRLRDCLNMLRERAREAALRAAVEAELGQLALTAPAVGARI